MLNPVQKNILVFCPNWVGDVVMATPVLSCLRENFKDARLIGVIRRYARGVIDDGPWFDMVQECDDKRAGGFLNLIKALRDKRPHMAILLTNSFRSALIAYLSGATHIIGYRRNGRSILLKGPTPFRNRAGIVPIPMVQYYLALCRHMKLNLPSDIRPRLYFDSGVAEKGDALLQKYKIFESDMVIGLNPGAKFGSSKCWPPEYFAELAELLEKKLNCKIILFTGPGEAEIANTIVSQSSARIINTAPDTIDLALLKYFIKRCQLLITNDTGTRHYGVAFQIPVVVIMGPTDPRYTAVNLEQTLIIRKKLPCVPCHKKICPLGHHDCMKLILPKKVFDGSIKLLEKLNPL